MLAKLLLLFVVVPLVELTLLLLVADLTSWQITLAMVILTGVVGAWLARQQGWEIFRRIREDMAGGRLPADTLLEAGMVLFAAALLLTPGPLTDVIGISLLIPPLRRKAKDWLVKWFRSRFKIVTYRGTGKPQQDESDDVIDSQVVEGSRIDSKADY